MTKYSFLIVDDEPLARKLILAHASKVEVLEEAGSCGSAVEAVNFLRGKKVDLIFLDIQMPELDGLAFLKTLQQRPAIILTTGYREFAVDAFDLDVVDYLVKPISFERFLKAVDRFLQTSEKRQVFAKGHDEKIVEFRADRKIFPIEVGSILYVESLDNYVKVHVTNQVLITRENITTAEERLGSDFVRIHRSFLVARRHIKSYSGDAVLVGGRELPFGRAFKMSALEKLRRE